MDEPSTASQQRERVVGAPLTPARLAERIGLTSGATSILLNRLEAAGHITRRRGHADRRVVTLHSTRDIHAAAETFFGPLGAQLDAALTGLTEAELNLLHGVVERLRRLTDAYQDTPADPADG